jgi:hypothetical protein
VSRSWLEGRFGAATLRFGRDEVRVQAARGRRVDPALIEMAKPETTASGAAWQGSLEAFVRLLARAQQLPRQIRLVVSNEFVHYALAPWTSEPLSDDEREQLVRALLAQRYGEQQKTWRIAIEPQQFEKPALAAAIDDALVAAAQEAAAQHGYRLTAMVPALIDTLNIHRNRVAKAKRGWLVDASDGRKACVAFADGQWAQVVNERANGSPSALLDSLLPQLRRDAIRLAALAKGTVLVAHGKGLSGVIDHTWPVVRLDGAELQA